LTQHQAVIQHFERDATGAADGFVQRSWAQQGDGERLDSGGERVGTLECLGTGQLTQQAGLHAVEAQLAFEVLGHGLRAAGPGQCVNDLFQ
jgi:hypothetical protein